MGKSKKTRKFAATKRVLNVNKDARLKSVQEKITKQKENKKRENDGELVREVPQVSSSLFFQYNAALGPPYRVIIDTNFINFSIQNKIEPIRGMMDCLQAKCIPCITDCVMAELEKLGNKFRIALRIARDERFERLSCMHKGTYADDCIAARVLQHRCYIVATNDQALRRRIRKIPGVPIMYVGRRQYKVERLPMELS